LKLHKTHYERGNRFGCLICGKLIIYSTESAVRICSICDSSFESNAVCESGHYICDGCHASAQQDYLWLLRHTDEKNPVKLFSQIAALESVNMHGPEHHVIVPCVLLTAYRNSGGEIDLDAALKVTVKRGAQVPGGICGFWGACGAAIGVGIYASVLTGSNPLNAEVWSVPQILTSRCLEEIAKVGGPRCCKRTSRIAIETAAQFTGERFGVQMPTADNQCDFYAYNKECLHGRCPYYGGHGNAV